MDQVEALNNIAKAIEHLAAVLGGTNLILILFLIFKNMGASGDKLSDIAYSIQQIFQK